MSLENTKLLITPNGYKAGKLYSALPESGAGDSTFARATTARRYNAEGLIEEVGLNVPRVDYPVLGGCPSLLLEPQGTNLVTYSEEFDNSSWIKTGLGVGVVPTVTANAGTAPDGNFTAERVVFDNTGQVTSGDLSLVEKNLGSSLSNDISISIWLKSNDVNTYNLYFGRTTGKKSIIEANQEWQRYKFSYNDAVAIFAIGLRGTTGSDNTADVLIWGAQLEQGTQATSYIPTLASAVTRNTDVLSNDMTATVDSTYTALLDVSATDSRLKIEDGTTGFDLPLNGAGRIVMVVDSDITFHFPDNGQATTVLTYAKPSDLRNIDVLSKINETKIKVIAVENGVALQSRIDSWVSGSVSSYFIETDWALESSFVSEFRESDWDYFPLIDTSNGTDFNSTWRDNNFTSFPLIDTSIGANFAGTWINNNLTSFPRLNMDNGTTFFVSWTNNNLTTWLPNYFDTCVGTNFSRAWENNAIDQIGVDNILVSINTARLAGVQTGTTKIIGINFGTNATPSATGQAATDALRADGWTVNLNGY